MIQMFGLSQQKRYIQLAMKGHFQPQLMLKNMTRERTMKIALLQMPHMKQLQQSRKEHSLALRAILAKPSFDTKT